MNPDTVPYILLAAAGLALLLTGAALVYLDHTITGLRDEVTAFRTELWAWVAGTDNPDHQDLFTGDPS